MNYSCVCLSVCVDFGFFFPVFGNAGAIRGGIEGLTGWKGVAGQTGHSPGPEPEPEPEPEPN